MSKTHGHYMGRGASQQKQCGVQAREIAERLDTSGIRAQVLSLEVELEGLKGHTANREAWLDQNVSVLHRYARVAEELRHRINARVAAIELDPPEEVGRSLGIAPESDAVCQRQWTSAVAKYAEARMSLGPDLTDASILEASQWRDAVADYRSGLARTASEAPPILRRAI